MNRTGKYVYGFVGSNGKAVCCVKDTSAVVQESKIPRQVHFIPYQDIAAVVSDSDMVDYAHMPKDALARLLVEHQKTIEDIMSLDHAIVPMRLGTFVADETEARDILSRGYGLIRKITHEIEGKLEMDVAAVWSDFGLILKEIGESEQVREFKKQLLAGAEGVTADDRMKAGLLVKTILDRMRDEHASKIQNALKTVSHESKLHEPMDDRMVINAAFLMERSRQGDFMSRVEDLNKGFCDRLNFRCVGPLPPYSFYTLEIKRMEFKDLDWARRKLVLQNGASADEVKKAYLKQAVSSHPDKNPDRTDTKREFDETNKAYRILVDYCLAAGQAGGSGSLCFDEEEFRKNAVLLKVRE